MCKEFSLYFGIDLCTDVDSLYLVLCTEKFNTSSFQASSYIGINHDLEQSVNYKQVLQYCSQKSEGAAIIVN